MPQRPLGRVDLLEGAHHLQILFENLGEIKKAPTKRVSAFKLFFKNLLG